MTCWEKKYINWKVVRLWLWTSQISCYCRYWVAAKPVFPVSPTHCLQAVVWAMLKCVWERESFFSVEDADWKQMGGAWKDLKTPVEKRSERYLGSCFNLNFKRCITWCTGCIICTLSSLSLRPLIITAITLLVSA